MSDGVYIGYIKYFSEKHDTHVYTKKKFFLTCSQIDVCE